MSFARKRSQIHELTNKNSKKMSNVWLDQEHERQKETDINYYFATNLGLLVMDTSER